MTNGESKKEAKTEKRKSTLPFAKLRATIRGKGKDKAAEKTEDKPAEAEAVKEAEPAAAEPVAAEPLPRRRRLTSRLSPRPPSRPRHRVRRPLDWQLPRGPMIHDGPENADEKN